MKIVSSTLLACICLVSSAQDFKEKYRPQFHFTPPANWINDPNGLLYYKGNYHLYYQSNPFGNVWGHMSWSHATSKDLIHWQHLAVAIPEEKNYMIFSGSAVVDKTNTTGFATKPGQVPVVAMYTANAEGNQSQQLAYSFDEGKTFTQYAANPVLDLHKRDFRDPGVFWYAPSKKWIVAVVLPFEHQVQFYSSANLKKWSLESSFGPLGDTSGVWECPQLIQAPVAGAAGKKKWVLYISMNSTMQYYVGEFDGKTFVNENPADKINRPDYGSDYYAAIAYNNLPADKAPVTIGWINNWQYANDIPTYPWKGAMSLPRNISVQKLNNEWVLIQKPVSGFEALRKQVYATDKLAVTGIKLLPVNSQVLELEADLTTATTGGIQLAAGNGHSVLIGYDAVQQKLFIDRTNSGDNSFSKTYPAISKKEVSLVPENNRIHLHIYYDKSIVEVFANGGKVAMTAQLFPDEKDNGVNLYSAEGTAVFEHIKIWTLGSVH